MAISEKIEKQIKNLDNTDEETKELMLELLKAEDNGTRGFRETYEEIINKHIGKKEEGEISDDNNR